MSDRLSQQWENFPSGDGSRNKKALVNNQYLLWLGMALAIAVVGLVLLKKRPRGVSNPAKSEVQVVMTNQPPPQLQSEAAVPFPPALPHSIVFGANPQSAGIRITPLSDEERYRNAKPMPADSMVASKLLAGMQAVPSLLVAEGHQGKKLMEVVINGDLVRASDGAGFRAFALDANGKIAEHAKLLDAGNLQNLVNAAAVWQIASVIVAQKHLADISAKLDEIRKGVKDVSSFLDEERRSKVTGTYEYLEQAASVLHKGELSPSIRNELETCTRELLQVQDHLRQELRRRSSTTIASRDTYGTDLLLEDTRGKYEALSSLVKDLQLTLKTLALTTYVLSLYPGEPAVKQARMEGLMRSLDEARTLEKIFEKNAVQDADQFQAWLNFESTLLARRTEVREAGETLSRDLNSGSSEVRLNVQETETRLLAHDAPTHIVFEVEDGRIGGFRTAF